jgi:hypothetical protein
MLRNICWFISREIVGTCHAGIKSYNFPQWCWDNKIGSEYGNGRKGLMGGVKILNLHTKVLIISYENATF